MRVSARLQMFVGAILLLVAAGLLVGLLLLGERPLAGGTRIAVQYRRVANLKPGADVKFFGRPAGTVLGVIEPRSGGLARVDILLRNAYAGRVWSNARIYITATSVIGERFVDIAPPRNAPGSPIREGQVLRGIDPPDLDAFFNRTYAVMNKVFALARREGPAVRQLLSAVSRMRARVQALRLPERLPTIGGRVLVAYNDARVLRGAWQHASDSGRGVQRIRRAAEGLVERYGARLAQLAVRAREGGARLVSASRLVAPTDQTRVARLARRMRATAARFDAARAQLADVLRRLARGQGTLGRMLNDRELTDDLKRASKDLKERPWRVLGKPPRDRAPRGARRRPKR